MLQRTKELKYVVKRELKYHPNDLLLLHAPESQEEKNLAVRTFVKAALRNCPNKAQPSVGE